MKPNLKPCIYIMYVKYSLYIKKISVKNLNVKNNGVIKNAECFD